MAARTTTSEVRSVVRVANIGGGPLWTLVPGGLAGVRSASSARPAPASRWARDRESARSHVGARGRRPTTGRLGRMT